VDYARTIEVVGAEKAKPKEQAKIMMTALMAMEVPKGTRSLR